MKKMNNMNRREFVRHSAVGAASAAMANVFVQRALAQTTGAKRVIFWWVPEGCAQQAFWPADLGNIVINPNASVNGKNPKSNAQSIRNYVDRSMASFCLQPLQRHISDFSLYSGFANNQGASATDAHKKAIQAALTGGTPNQGSIDQILAPRLKGDAPIGSIYLPMWGHHVHNRGANDSYMSPARRVGGGTFGSSNWNPMETYNQLFSNGVPGPDQTGGGPAGFDENLNTRMLALKSAEAQLDAVKCAGGEEAQRKLEILLTSYRQLEQDAQALLDANSNTGSGVDVRFDIPNGWTNTNGSRTDSSKYWNRPENFEKLLDICIDTTVAAFALDRTRVSLMQFSGSGTDIGPASNDHYKTLNIPGLEPGDVNDHYLGHDPNVVRRRNQARIFRWYYGKFASLIDKLKAVPEGNGTLFDNTLIVTCTEFSMFNHRVQDMPYILAGGDNINFEKGVYRNVSNGNNMRNHADFFLGAARLLGTGLDRFGNSSTPYNFS